VNERGVIATFSIDQKSARELRHYLDSVAAQCSCSRPATSSPSTAENSSVTTPANASQCSETTQVADGRLTSPVVIILDDLHHVSSPALLADAFSSLLGLPLHHWYM